MIVYDKPIAAEILWIEFQPETRDLRLIHENGTDQPLGIKVGDNIANHLESSKQATLLHIQDATIHSAIQVSVVIQDY